MDFENRNVFGTGMNSQMQKDLFLEMPYACLIDS